MTDKLVYEKAIKYLNKLLNQKPLISIKEINEVKIVKEKLNSFMYYNNNERIRSKNANSYCWLLCTRLADSLQKSKEEIYFDMLRNYGQSILIPVLKGTSPAGYSKYFEYETSSILNGKEADWYKLYKGSSKFNTKEMSIFLNGIIQECTQLSIPTMRDEDLEKMIGNWRKEED